MPRARTEGAVSAAVKRSREYREKQVEEWNNLVDKHDALVEKITLVRGFRTEAKELLNKKIELENSIRAMTIKRREIVSALETNIKK